MRVVIVVLAVAVVLVPALSGPLEPTIRFHSRRQAGPRLGDLIWEFALDLSSESWSEPGNVVFSPYSITSLLSMLLMATTGSTKSQLRSALFYSSANQDIEMHRAYQNLNLILVQDKPGITFNIANKIFVQTGVEILNDFSRDAHNFYGMDVRSLDFARNPIGARDAINSWVKSNTKGKIPKLLDMVNPQTTVLAVNTIYFKADWQTPFLKKLTHNGIFNTGTKQIPVPMMSTMMNVDYLNLPDANAEMIALPYQGGQFAMFFIVPRGPVSLNNLLELEFYFDAETLRSRISQMRSTQLNVLVPRMTLRFKTNLADGLKNLGVTSLFDARADFSPMTLSTVAVDRIIHETVIEITEEGTVAAAATAADLNRSGSSRSVSVDRLAIMFIMDLKNMVPLFWGRIVDPEVSNTPENGARSV